MVLEVEAEAVKNICIGVQTGIQMNPLQRMP
jgi:hypothetical protein